jgi:hypothetical protein
LRFYNLTNSNEGFIFPEINITAYSDGKVKEIEWEWKIKTGEGLLDADSKLVELLTIKDGNNRGLMVDLIPESNFYGQFYALSEIEVGAYDVEGEHNPFIPEFEGIDYTKNEYLDVYEKDYWTLGGDVTHLKFDPIPKGTMFEVLAPYNYLSMPSNFESQSEVLPLLDNEASLVGIKYNLYYYNILYSIYREEWLYHFPEDYWYFKVPYVNGLIRFVPPYIEFTNIDQTGKGLLN